jgi:hypothetical protein
VPTSVVLGDVNNDGKLDIVAGGWQTMNVLLGKGDGSFGAYVDYSPPTWLTSVVLGDVNDDGKLDILTTNEYQDGLGLLLGKGDGTFAAVTGDDGSALGNLRPKSVAVGDLNGDGKTDLVAANGTGTVRLLFGNGGGTFAPAVDYAAATICLPWGGGPDSVALGDLNGDGRLDIAVTNQGADTVNVLISSCH